MNVNKAAVDALQYTSEPLYHSPPGPFAGTLAFCQTLQVSSLVRCALVERSSAAGS